MQKAADRSASSGNRQAVDQQSVDQSDSYGSIISNLGSLVEQVRVNMKLIEVAIAREASPGNQEAAANIVVLDDVTPGYAQANDALRACNASLGVALQLLRDIRSSKQETDGRLVGLTRCA